jgi:antitoxin component YwqK of YwqJK toxin-antitoxin module
MDPDNDFQENLERYARYNAFLATYITLLDCSSYEFTHTHMGELNLRKKTDNGYLYYHSVEGAKREAEAWFESIDIRNYKTLILFGVGLGYYYQVLKPWLRGDPERRVIFIEDDLCVIKKFLETENATEILSDPQAILHAFHADENEKAAPRDFDYIVRSFMPGMTYLSSLQLYWNTRKEACMCIRANIYLRGSYYSMLQSELQELRADVFTNFYSNIPLISDCYRADSLYGAFPSVPAIICGAGSSITSQLPALKEAVNRAIVFASGSAMNILNEHEIFPHFGPGLDPTTSQLSRIRTNYAYEIPYFVRARFQNEAWQTLHGPKIYVGGNCEYLIYEWFEKELGIFPEKSLQVGVSSTNFSLEFARILGCNPIILIGVDLAYTDSSRYAKGVKAHPAENRIEHLSLDYKPDRNLVGRDNKGKMIKTKLDWQIEANIIGDFQNDNPGTHIINATAEGLEIPLVDQMDFNEAIKKYLKKDSDFRSWIHTEIQDANYKGLTKEKALEVIDKWRRSLKACDEKYEQLKREIEKEWKKCLEGRKLPQRPYNGAIALLETEIEEEEVYKYLFPEIRQIIIWKSDAQKHLLKCHPELFTDIQRDLKELEIDLNNYVFFQEAARFHLKVIDEVLEKYKKIEGAASERKESLKLKPIEEITAGDTYSFTNGHLIISDKQMNLYYEDHFEPEKLPLSAFLNRGGKGIGLVFNKLFEGQALLYHRNGYILAEMYYKKGFLHGPVTYYNRQGKLSAKSWFFNGKQEGKKWEYYRSGKVYSIQRYRNGEPDGIQERYYEDGSIKSVVTFSKGKLDGDVILYYPSGFLKRELHFKEGKLHGSEKMWSPINQPIIEAEYIEGKPTGISRHWYKNGVLAREVKFYELTEEFDLTEWDQEGKLVREVLRKPLDQLDENLRKRQEILRAIDQLNIDMSQYDSLTEEEKANLIY